MASGIPFTDDNGTCDTDESRALLRESAAKTITLLKNDRQVLPLDPQSLRTLAVIGDCARVCNSSGGGSAAVPVETYSVTPLDAITQIAAERGVKVSYEEGVRHYKYIPTIDPFLHHPDGHRSKTRVGRFEGWMEQPHPDWKASDAGLKDLPPPSFATDHSSEKIAFLDGGYGDPLIDTEARFVKVCPLRHSTKPELTPLQYTTIFTPNQSGSWEFGFTSVDQALVFIDGKLVVDYTIDLEEGTLFFSFCHKEKRVVVDDLERGRQYEIEIRSWDTGRYGSVTISMSVGFQLGAVKTLDSEQAVDRAVRLAASSDAAIVIVGLNKDYEAEGYDRNDLQCVERLSDRLAGADVTGCPELRTNLSRRFLPSDQMPS